MCSSPRGMTYTGWYAPGEVPNMAHNYVPIDKPGTSTAFRNTYRTGPPGNPSGGAYSTVGDLTRFAQALLGTTYSARR